MGVLRIICLGCPQTAILPISASQVARIVHVGHLCLATQAMLLNIFTMFKVYLKVHGMGEDREVGLFSDKVVFYVSFGTI
jgi:hypothetical protein